ncbi:MAG: selenide, water dikinase SelD [Bacteroidota bacterium]
MSDPVRLTQFSKGSGCGCKIAPAVLEQILHGSRISSRFPGLLVGTESNDDASVLRMDGGICLISTADFFTPIVDDAYDFGRIAAANALSDVYAMGGRPLMAVAILGFPVEKLPPSLAARMLEGARTVCADAGIPLAGGHSIDSQEPIFGLSVNGTVDEAHLKRNNTAQEGDRLFLTKPLGLGIVASAAKRGLASDREISGMVEVMTRLNSAGAELGRIPGVHAMTDVTGFGLLGHLSEVCDGSGVSAELHYDKLLHVEGAQKYRDQFVFPDNTYRNWNAYEKKVKGVNGPEFITLCDPQTSGGLLVAAGEHSVGEVEAVFRMHGLTDFLQPVGKLKPREAWSVEVK